QKPKAKSQKPKAKSQKPKAKSQKPKAYLQYRQAVTVKLEFYDNETKKPITISVFLTIADLDHRDFLQYSRDSGIQGVYVTNNQNSGSTLKGTYNPASDPSTVIVNSNGRNEFNKDLTASLSSPDLDDDASYWDSAGDVGDPIQANNTDAWATVIFGKTQSIQYSISEWQRMDFLATALVPVAFSAPGKAGDSEKWSTDWDDNSIEYNTTAALPCRGSTIKNPQHSLADNSTFSTFHPSTKFELKDPVDKNLQIDKVTIKQNGLTDVTDQFAISVVDNKVTATAKPEFLGVSGTAAQKLAAEDNYAKVYDMSVETSLAPDADISSYPTETGTDDKGVKHTYAKIANTSHLDVVKVADATPEGWDSNETFGHVKVPDTIREVENLTQKVKNLTDTSWKTKTTGHRGDSISYKFGFNAKQGNTANVTNAVINDIKMAPDELGAPTNVQVKVGTADATSGTATANGDGTYSIAVGKGIAKGEAVEVTFNREVNADAAFVDHTQTGKMTASLSTPIADADNFNSTVLTVEDQKAEATDVTQKIKNATPGSESAWAATAAGKVGDEIDYQFAFKAPSTNRY
ncbi:hypothetical protein, partial [Latilactobacillus sakei]|uniref:hypothetical protein n=1 Tax=Latilactobacillus sakei TaxID=1599 RepID=UPI0025B58D54